MVTPPDHYRALGVPRFAPPALVRRAYVAHLKGHHAGGIPLPEDRLRRIGSAYWELRHPDRRAVYDMGLRERERRRTATGRPVTKRTAPRVQLSSRSPRPGTKLMFATSLALLAGGIAWALEQRPSSLPSADRPVVAVVRPDTIAATSPKAAMIDEARLDYHAMMVAGGREHVERFVRQCFADMRVSAPAAVFDYCVALDGLAATELGTGARGFFGDAERRARLAAVAFGPADAAVARWQAINQMVATP